MDDLSAEDGGSLAERQARRRGVMSAYSRVRPYLLVDDADFGDHNAGVRDPGRSIWWIASPRDDIGEAEYDWLLAKADRTQ